MSRQLRSYHKNRADWFCGKVCAECNDPERLELHHVDPLVKESHKIWQWSKKRREEELKKCIPLCIYCHRKRHGKVNKTSFSKGRYFNSWTNEWVEKQLPV